MQVLTLCSALASALACSSSDKSIFWYWYTGPSPSALLLACFLHFEQCLQLSHHSESPQLIWHAGVTNCYLMAGSGLYPLLREAFTVRRMNKLFILICTFRDYASSLSPFPTHRCPYTVAYILLCTQLIINRNEGLLLDLWFLMLSPVYYSIFSAKLCLLCMRAYLTDSGVSQVFNNKNWPVKSHIRCCQ